jgi:hypothetical protein
MTDNNSRLRQWCRLFAPILTARYDKWCARRAKARRAYERHLAALAEPPTPPVEPEPPRDVHDRFIRMAGRPREDWRRFADSLDADKRALHHRIGRPTNAADNFRTRRGRGF